MIRRAGAVVAALLAIGAAPDSLAVGTPQAVEAAARSETTVRVYWNTVPDAARYEVLRDGAVIAAASADAREYTDTTGAANHTYAYNVVAIGTDGSRAPGRSYVERTYPALADTTKCDVLVVGANSAGFASAVVAARYGLRVVLTEETRRIGGMAANGLGISDIRRGEDASGIFEEFRANVRAIYGKGDGLQYEPRVAQQAFKQIMWSAPPTLTVCREVRPVRVIRKQSRVTEVIAEDLRSGRKLRFEPQIVVDATECGDVAAAAGAAFRVGREARSARETHAGYIFYDRGTDQALPGSTGKADRRIQAYAYLMTVKDYGLGTDHTIAPPNGYDPTKYNHALKWASSWATSSGVLPNHKFEVNQHPHGSDLQEVNYRYPTATPEERRKIEQQYRDHALGYLYYLQTVEGKRNIGLSEDDYRDNDGWPTLLYIREARRFVGDVMIDESDIQHAREYARPNAIGIGDYAMDSHAAERKTNWATPDMGEGEYYMPQRTPWHQVPFSIMIPQGLDNLFVPTAVSATHVAYSTYRMEPVRMHFGAAAGVAATICVRYGTTTRDAPVRLIQAELLKSRGGTAGDLAKLGVGAAGPSDHPTFLYLFADVRPGNPFFAPIQWLGARGLYPCPIPAKLTASSGLQAAKFCSDLPATEDDAVRLYNWLLTRMTDEERKGLNVLVPVQGKTLTRARAAIWLTSVMRWHAPSTDNAYADLTAGSPECKAANALKANWIDSRLWDGSHAYGSDGSLLFRPDEPMTRGQLAQLAMLAQNCIGPLWDDHPADKVPTVPIINTSAGSGR